MHDILEKISGFASFGWGVMLKQAMVSGAVSLAFLILLLYFATKIYASFSAFMRNVVESDKPFCWTLFGVCYCGIGAPALYYILIDVLTGFFNPHYWAIAKILDAVK